jgi:3'-phosphoadenosine 5'-phosphosulfate sulfotransferase (PAPS reductase)/FAD synthetase
VNAESAADWLASEGFDLAILRGTAGPEEVDHAAMPDLSAYDRIVVAFSGGADSLALLLHLLDLGVPPSMIEAHHHLVDGREGSRLMDWPVTEGYCQAVCAALGIELTFSWREGGFEREMLRQDAPTAPVWIPDAGGHRRLGGTGPLGTRLRFPQVTANLAQRWCSAALKIDVFARYLCNHPKFLGSRTLVLTGERAEESKARAAYKGYERHRCDTRDSRRVPRQVDVWRAVHGWSKKEVWNLIAKWKVCAHPAYHLGFGRCSCRGCIFGSSDQWATIQQIAPAQFGQISGYEREFKVTIHRRDTIGMRAAAGTPYDTDPRWVEIANMLEFDHPVFTDPWILPAGAFGESCGPL